MGALAMAAMLLVGAASPEIRVDVGQVKAEALPPLQRTNRPLPTPAMVQRVQRMLEAGECDLRGQSKRRFDIDVPYAVLVRPDGKATRVVVSELGCPALETYVGLLVLEMARIGDFKSTGEPKPRWFASNLNFTLE